MGFHSLILGIDPGETTGAVLLRCPDISLWREPSHEGLELISGFVSPNYGVFTCLLLIAHLGPGDIVALEHPPRQGNDPKLLEAYGQLLEGAERTGAEIHTPYPGEWKPVMKTLKPKLPECIQSVHVKDAYQMSLHVLRKHQGLTV